MTSPKTFQEAAAMCEADGAYLSSVYDGYEQAYIETQMYLNEMATAWIGLADVS